MSARQVDQPGQVVSDGAQVGAGSDERGDVSPPVVFERGVGSDLDNEVGLHAHHFDVLVAPVPDVAATDDLRPRVIVFR